MPLSFLVELDSVIGRRSYGVGGKSGGRTANSALQIILCLLRIGIPFAEPKAICRRCRGWLLRRRRQPRSLRTPPRNPP